MGHVGTSQLRIIANFKTIRDSAVHDGQEDPAELWEDASKIMALAKDIQTKIGAAELFDAFPKMQDLLDWCHPAQIV